MEEDVKKILATMISMSIQSDYEMFNMGDYSEQDLYNATNKKIECSQGLRDSSIDISAVPHELLYKAIHDLALYLRVFGPDDGMETMQSY